MMFELWRQDDNGIIFLVESYRMRAEAEGRLAELTRCWHKQTYWITERADEECFERARKPCAEDS